MTQIPVRFFVAASFLSALIAGIGGTLILFGDRVARGLPIDASLAKGIGYFIIGGFFFGLWLVRQFFLMANPHIRYAKIMGMKQDSGRGNHEIVLRLTIEGTEGGVRGETIVLPSDITLDQLRDAAKIIVQGGYSFTSALSGNNAPFSRSQLEWLRDALVSHGMAKWNSPRSRNQGVTLDQAGRSLFRKLSELEDEAPAPSLLRALKSE